MNEKKNKIFIKNMVCQRCVLTVENILRDLNITFNKVSLGEVEFSEKPANAELNKIQKALNHVGFELIDTRINKIIEDIKQAAMQYLELGMENQNLKLSSFITNKIPNDYSYLSDLFSSIEEKDRRTIFYFTNE